MSMKSRRAKKLHARCGHEQAQNYDSLTGFINYWCPDCYHYAIWNPKMAEFEWRWVKPNAPTP